MGKLLALPVAAVEHMTDSACYTQERENRGSYCRGDITKGLIAKGKEARGDSANSTYTFGDLTRGVFYGKNHADEKEQQELNQRLAHQRLAHQRLRQSAQSRARTFDSLLQPPQCTAIFRSKLANSTDDKCAICISSYEGTDSADIVVTVCGHHFHKSCAAECAIHGMTTCPSCRQ